MSGVTIPAHVHVLITGRSHSRRIMLRSSLSRKKISAKSLLISDQPNEFEIAIGVPGHTSQRAREKNLARILSRESEIWK